MFASSYSDHAHCPSDLASLTSMNVLLTGGAGFIGSHVAERLLRDGHAVDVIDNFDPFYASSVKEANVAAALASPRCRLYRGDLRDRAFLAGLPAGHNAIIHLAAKAGVRPSIQDPIAYQQANVEGTQYLLEFARTRGIRQFVFASSSSVYGVNPRVPWREDDAVLQPISPYASTKVSGELLGHVYAHLFGVRFIGLRFFTVYGPRQRPDLAIHKFSRLILAGKPLPFYGDGSTRRDYTYIDDIVAGVIGALHYQASNYEVINLGNNRTVSLSELVAALEVALGRKAVLDHQPEQPGDVPQTWADVGKAARLLGYAPVTTLPDGLRDFAAWLRAQPA
jgi:UDP-glucuronate 4-epimerase